MVVALGFAAVALLYSTSPAPATINNNENAVDELGEYSTPTTDTTLVFTKNCAYNGASPIGFDWANYGVFDTVNHRLFISDSGNSRVLVFTLNTNNTIASKTPANVLGQADFHSCEPNAGGSTTAASMYWPEGLAFDGTNNLLYVADSQNSRVLVFNTATITNGMSASYEFGQPSGASEFTTNGCDFGNFGSVTAAFLCGPQGLAFDSTNSRLYVADSGNNRVLIFSTSTLTDGKNASFEFGQPSGASEFTSNTAATSQSGMSGPQGLAFDSANKRLYVSDSNNYRVLEFSTSSLSDGPNAAIEFGQASGAAEFTTGTSGGWTQSTFGNGPQGLAFDSTNSRLFVGDGYRVMVFSTASLSDGKNASFVIGQPSFTATNYNSGQNGCITAGGGTIYDSTNNYFYCMNSQFNSVHIFNVAATLPTPSSPTQSGNDACTIAGGQLYCWGWNLDGEGGFGNTNYSGDGSALPLLVGTDTTWTAVSQADPAYDRAACGIDNGALYCWGNNANGELGLGNTTQYTTPQQVGTDTTWTAISTSGNDTCGIDSGKLYCWGINTYGELGLGNTTAQTTPQQVGAATNWIAISTGGQDTCGIRGSSGTGSLYCWGRNQYGEVGNTYNTAFVTSTTYTGAFGSVAAANTACAARATAASLPGTFLAWVAVTTGTDDPNTTFTHSVAPYEEVGGTIIAYNWTGLISGTLTNAITLNESGSAVSASDVWTNVAAASGKASTSASSATKNCTAWTNNSSPVASHGGDFGVTGSATATWSASSNIACNSTNRLYCFRQDATPSQQTSPVQIGILTTWSAISQGGNDTCGIAGGALFCWGENNQGELGVGNTNQYNGPQPVGASVTTTAWTAVSIRNDGGLNDRAACAIEASKLYCWGNNAQGELGLGNTTAFTTPQHVGALSTWTAVTEGGNDTCAIAGSQLYCWGQNNLGEDGLGNQTQFTSPQAVTVGSIGNGENAIDALGQYNSLTSTSSNSWGKYGPNNGPSPYGFFAGNTPGGIALDPVHHSLFAVDAFFGYVMVYTLNTDNSIPTTSGGHTATYALGETDFIGDCNNCGNLNYAGGPGLALDPINNRLFVGSYCSVNVFSTTSISTGMSGTFAIGATDNNGDGRCGTTQSTWGGGGGSAFGLAFDAVNNRLFVADPNDNRVMVFSTSSLTYPLTATYELGQPSGSTAFTTNGCNQGGISASTLCNPSDVAFDPVNERLFVVDPGNNRILVFNVAPGVIANGENASYELGQPSGSTAFTTNGNATTQSGLYMSGWPGWGTVAYDANNSRLFESEPNNARIMVFNVGPSVIANGENASFVLGATDFVGDCVGCTGYPDANGNSTWFGMLYYDPGSSRLFAQDVPGNRILIFDTSAMSTNTQTGFIPGYE